LAVLELVKQHELHAAQQTTFGEIVLHPISPTTPNPDPLQAQAESAPTTHPE
jgi:chromatin segregation and condensation protein Rec8/ScpA/Scc1 (kleisin family)